MQYYVKLVGKTFFTYHIVLEKVLYCLPHPTRNHVRGESQEYGTVVNWSAFRIKMINFHTIFRLWDWF